MEAAIVHDYFVQDGGAEHVAIELAGLLPKADVYTTFFDAATFGARLDPTRVHAWRFNRSFGRDHFRAFLPLYPLYFSQLDLRRARLVVSSSSAFSKAVRTGRRALHVAYIHSPMRFAWGLDDYLRDSSFRAPSRMAAWLLRAPLAAWDRETARRPDVLVANSETVRQRIRRFWGRDAEVIHPVVDTTEFRPSTGDDGYLLVAARLLAYRGVDLVVDAATATGRELVIAGDGPERSRLERIAGPSVRFVGHVPRPALVDLFERCHAYVVAGVEDFGIAPVEAMACGKPVVAFARGGVTETVEDGLTGVLFHDQTAHALVAALDKLDGLKFDPTVVRARAERFDRSHFIDAWRTLLAREGVENQLSS